MNRTDDKESALIRASSIALARTELQALARRGLRDLAVAEQKTRPPVDRLCGLGKRLTEKLNAAGITTFEVLADMTPEQLEGIEGIGTKDVEEICFVVGSYFATRAPEALATAAEDMKGKQVENRPQLLFCLDHQCSHDECPDVPHLDFALVPIDRAVKLPRAVPHLWTGPADVAHGWPPGCSFCGESDPAQYGKPCPKRICTTWYEILGVPEEADKNQINDAYHELANEWSPKRLQHPDDEVFDAGYSATQMMWLNAARAVLENPEKRRQYDAELTQQHQSDPEWWTRKGNLLDGQARHSEALDCHEKALELDPRCALAWINKGLCLNELGRWSDAAESYDRAIEIDTSDWRPHLNKGYTLNQLGHHEEAIRCFDAAIRLSTDLIGAWTGRGTALDHLERYSEALASYDEILKINRPSWTEHGRASSYSDAWNMKGVTHAHARRFNDAIDCYDRAITLDPRYANPRYNKGIALMKAGDHVGAIRCYDEALELWPEHAESWHNKGLCLRDLRRIEEAIVCYDKALACDPPEILAWHSKAQALEDLGRSNDAVSSYERYLSVAPVDAQHTNSREHAQARVRVLKPIMSGP